MNKIKNILMSIIAIVLVGFVCFLLFSGTGHIEDTNGTKDTSLNTITNKNIIKMNIGSVGGPSISQNFLTGDSIKFSAKKFSGVYEILYDNFIGSSDFVLDITSFNLKEGNLKLVIVHDDKIVKTMKLKSNIEVHLEDCKGYYSFRIAGECANFSFYMSEVDYNTHEHL